jgi:hypothetical protein
MQAFAQADKRQDLLTSGEMVIDRPLAEIILNDCRYPRQRKIYTHHVDLLRGLMRRGEWWDDDQLTFCRLPSGKLYLVNGYHRLTAIAAEDLPVKFSIRILQAVDMDAVNRCYTSFDTMNRKRSETEILGAMGIQEKFGLKGAFASAVYRAIPIIANKFYMPNYQTDPTHVRDVMARIEMSADYWVFGRTYQDLLNDGSHAIKTKLLSASVAAVALVTIKHQPGKAAQFWSGVALLSGVQRRDPRHTLNKKLLDTRYPNQFKHGTIPLAANDCAVAWNAFMQGREIGVLREAAFRLVGTPWR